MEPVIAELPQEEVPAWEPPVVDEPPKGEVQSAADIFFMQYVVCILLLTTLLLLRLCDEGAFCSVTDSFRVQTAAPSLPWAERLLGMVADLWS